MGSANRRTTPIVSSSGVPLQRSSGCAHRCCFAERRKDSAHERRQVRSSCVSRVLSSSAGRLSGCDPHRRRYVIAAAPVPFLLSFRSFREQLLAEVVFHELGHHLEIAIGAAARGGEAAAEDWSRRLQRTYLHRQYWWLRPIARVMRPLVAWEVRRRRRARRQPDGGD